MKIDLGNFGNATPGVTPAPNTAVVGHAAAELGRDAARAGLALRERRQTEARNRAATAALDHELAVKTTAEKIGDRIATGDLPYAEALQTFDDEVGAIEGPKIDWLDETASAALEDSRKRRTFEARQVVDRAVEGARRREGVAQFSQSLDALGKLGGMPGADVAEINSRAGALAPLARGAGVPANEIERTVQAFRDQNWLNHATQRYAEARESIDDLTKLEHDLVDADGFYSQKLDTNRRNAVLQGVLSRRAVLENRVAAVGAKQEARAERTIATIERQIASGVPATAEMWADWADTVAGTSVEKDFAAMQGAEREVQGVLRLPIEDQLSYVQQKEDQLLTAGGNLQDAANQARLSAAVKRNVTQLAEAPLIYNANRTGVDVPPLDLASLQDGTGVVAAQMQERVVTLDAMRAQYGEQVQLKPLLPQEAVSLASVINKASPRQAADLFGTLRNVIGDDEIYRAAVQQIAPDSPVRALAGLMAAKQRQLTLERNWVRDDVVALSGDVAATMLAGEAILNPSRAANAANGDQKLSLYLPGGANTTLQTKFADVVGAAFAQRPAAAELAFQGVQAYYVGRAAELGRTATDAQDVDSNLVNEAVRATLGEVISFNGEGEVFAPWGMGADAFEEKALQQLQRALPNLTVAQLSRVGLMNRSENSYYVTVGRAPQVTEKGDPLVIAIPVTGGGF